MKRDLLIKRALVVAAAALLFVSLAGVGLLDGARLEKGARNLIEFASDLFPPDLSVLATVAYALVETLQMAFAGTMLGFALALPLSLVATSVLFGPPVSLFFRLLLALVRTVPSLLWAIIFVVAVGLGPGAGTLGIALYTTGYLGKVFYEAFEGVDREVLEAVRGVGCSRLQLARYGVLPESANLVLAQLLFLFEYNVRASAIMGFVGAGGIGFYLLGYIQALQYDRMITALLLTLLVVVIIDWMSARLRSFVLSPVFRSKRIKVETARAARK